MRTLRDLEVTLQDTPKESYKLVDADKLREWARELIHEIEHTKPRLGIKTRTGEIYYCTLTEKGIIADWIREAFDLLDDEE